MRGFLYFAFAILLCSCGDKEFEVIYDNGFVMMDENGKDIALSEIDIEKYKLIFWVPNL